MLDTSSPLAGGCAWIEGEFKPADDARISIFDTGFRYSDTTYTAVSVWNGKLFRIDEHLDRVLDGAEKLHIRPAISRSDIRRLAGQVVEHSQLREAFLLICLTSGVQIPNGSSSVKQAPQLYIYSVPFRWVFSPAQQMNGIDLIVAETVRRATEDTITPAIKNFSWGDLTRARHEAMDKGAASAILLDINRNITEGPGFNIFTIKDGVLATPSTNCLPGITRRTAIEIAQERGLTVEIRDIHELQLRTADEIFASTTAGGITPINMLDGEPVGDGAPGPVTEFLRRTYWSILQSDSSMLTPVDY